MTKSNLLAAFIGGAAAGAAMGLLYAPQPGTETRSKLIKATNRSAVSLDQLIEDGKASWYKTKGRVETGAGIAANEMDEFMRHILKNGQKMWSKAKDKAGEMADDASMAAENLGDKARQTADRFSTESKRMANDLKQDQPTGKKDF